MKKLMLTLLFPAFFCFALAPAALTALPARAADTQTAAQQREEPPDNEPRIEAEDNSLPEQGDTKSGD